MKIIVCIKQIAHTYCRSGFDPDRHFLAPEDTLYRINPYDEAALGLALTVKEALGGGEIFLLTLGPLIAEAELRRCLALGANRIYHIDQEGVVDPWAKSSYLAQAIKDLEARLVLCGKESLDTQNGQVGAFLAHHLGRPFVSAITQLTVSPDGYSGTVQRSGGRGIRESLLCPLPAVFSVDMGAQGSLLPTYPDKKQAWSIPIQKIKIQDPMPEPRTITTEVFPPRPRPKIVPAPDCSRPAYERIEQLLMGSRIQKMGARLTGSPESQVEGIMDFLREHKFLKQPVGWVE
ncbi:MAG: electron transfer flavoprotein subunit beta/FixA family protein [Deltaproteobacteria bacterium]|nr:electron transfer flavoprotein subunit beta/FixA family protein [Deltaproteobacteria bacterium]